MKLIQTYNNSIGEGICRGACIQAIRSILCNKTIPLSNKDGEVIHQIYSMAFNRITKLNKKNKIFVDEEILKDVINKIAPNELNVSKLILDDFFEIDRQDQKQFNLLSDFQSSNQEKQLEATKIILYKLISTIISLELDSGILVSQGYDFSKLTGGHSVAFIFSDNNLYFIDPNIGIYMSQSLAAFNQINADNIEPEKYKEIRLKCKNALKLEINFVLEKIMFNKQLKFIHRKYFFFKKN